MIEQDGRLITLYTEVSLSGCSLCSLDPFTNTSTDSYCPSCSGEYWIPTYSGLEIQAHVTWGKMEDKSWETGGMIDNGDCTIKYMHTPAIEDLTYNASFFVVDARHMQKLPGGITLRGVPQVNRILVHLQEKEK